MSRSPAAAWAHCEYRKDIFWGVSPLCGAQRVGPIRLCKLRIHFGKCPQVAGDSSRVTAGNRAGQRRLTALQRVLQRCPRQRPDHPLGDAARRVAYQFLPQQFLTPQRCPQCLDGVE